MKTIACNGLVIACLLCVVFNMLIYFNNLKMAAEFQMAALVEQRKAFISGCPGSSHRRQRRLWNMFSWHFLFQGPLNLIFSIESKSLPTILSAPARAIASLSQSIAAACHHFPNVLWKRAPQSQPSLYSRKSDKWARIRSFSGVAWIRQVELPRFSRIASQTWRSNRLILR